MNLSIIERAILSNQYQILAELNQGQSQSDNYKKKVEILENGYEGEYHEIFDRIDKDIFSDEDEAELFKILTMFSKIIRVVNTLDDDQKKQLNLEKLAFRGFDASHNTQFHFLAWWFEHNPTNFYKEDLGEIGGYNSHTQGSLPDYRRMLRVFEKFDFRGKQRHMTIEELKELSEA